MPTGKQQTQCFHHFKQTNKQTNIVLQKETPLFSVVLDSADH